jgi:glycosyltransferase involved in cell wall biosynthesis
MTAVSVTIPVFNEEGAIEKVVNDCHSEILAKIPGSELIVVNDGSTDATSAILERLRRQFGQLKVIHFEKNSGHGKALRAAFREARKPLVFQMDGDDQFSVKDFWQLYGHMERNDIAAGYRSPRHDRAHRKALSLVRWINVMLFGVSSRDANAPFKLIKSPVLQDILGDLPGDFSATPIVLLVLAKLKKYRVVEVPILHAERKTGKTSMAGLYLAKLCAIYLKDLLKLKYRILSGKLQKHENSLRNP